MKPAEAKNAVLVVFLTAVTVASFVYAGKIGISLSQAHARPEGRADGKINSLIVSVCSLRRDLLSEYGRSGPEVMPNLERFFRESSVVFSNLYNGIPWISIIAFFDRFFPELENRGYIPPGPFTEYPYVRVPLNKSRQAFEFRDTNDSNWEKDYRADFQWVKNSFPQYPNRPFTLVVHVKYMHYPLIDSFNADSEWDYYLSREEKSRLNEYLRNPSVYYRKLPFLLMMTSDPLYALAHPAVQALKPGTDTASRTRLLGLVTNERFIQEWKQSPGYEEDLRILKKVYAANARYMDAKILGPLLNLFGDESLKASTAVLFTGDHGEAHMERDKLTHATSAFDDTLAVPAALRLPGGHGRPRRVMEQVHMHTLAEFMRDVAVGAATSENWETRLRDLQEDVLIIRDCANSFHALRYKNRYKYILDWASGTRSLYDLEADPEERNDISGSHPERAAEMESLYWANLPRFKWIPLWRCAPWDENPVSF